MLEALARLLNNIFFPNKAEDVTRRALAIHEAVLKRRVERQKQREELEKKWRETLEKKDAIPANDADAN